MAAAPETFPGIFNQSSQQVSGTTLVAAVGLSSFSALLLELSLTRLFSVVLFYHFAFLAISVALLGLGAGGVLAYIGKHYLQKFATRRLASVLCLVQAALIPLALWIVL